MSESLPYRLQNIINAAYDMEALLHHLKMYIKTSGSCQCPFHGDQKCSAKLYPDNSIFCWTCNRRYAPYDVLHTIMELPNSQIIVEVKKAGKWTEPPRKSKKDEVFLFRDRDRINALKSKFKQGQLSATDYVTHLKGEFSEQA